MPAGTKLCDNQLPARVLIKKTGNCKKMQKNLADKNDYCSY